MRSTSPLGVIFWAWMGTLRLVGDLRLWSPLLLIALLRLGLLLGLLFFHRPEIAAVGPAAVELLGGEAATHYPEHLYLLLALFQPVMAGVGVLVGSLAEGAVTLRFAQRFGSQSAFGKRKGVVQHARSLVALFALILAVHVVFSVLLNLIPEEIRHWTTRVRLAFLALEWGGRLALQVFLAYAVAAIVIRTKPLFSAIRESTQHTLRLPLVTTLLVAATWGLMFPYFVLADIDLADRIPTPEFVVILAGIQILADLILSFLRLGSVTRVFVWRTEVQR